MDSDGATPAIERAPRMEQVNPGELEAVDGGFFFLTAFLPGMAAGYFGTKAILDQQRKLGSALRNVVPR